MADKVLINLATGMEDKERVLVAFLVATATLAQGQEVAVWTTKDAVRLGLPGEMKGEPYKDCPPPRAAVRPVRGGRREALAVPDLRARAGP
jgi:predicted peroxiredoxin